MRSALAGLVVLAVGCAHAPQGHSGPSQSQWIELTSRHFTLRTDLGRQQARAALADFEGVYGTLETVAFQGDAPRDRIDVVLFSDEARFRQLAPRGAPATSCRGSRTIPIRSRPSPSTGACSSPARSSRRRSGASATS